LNIRISSCGAIDTPRKTIALETLGCKLNQAESESTARQLAEQGYHLVHSSNSPDVYILNTCTVTHIADHKSRQLLRAARRNNPHATIIAMGCYAERNPQEISNKTGADLIVGNKDKDRLIHILERHGLLKNGDALCNQMLRTRSLVKIQQGCSQFCSYCVVPMLRGTERSIPLNTIIAEVKARIRDGYRELVLTGTRIGSYEGSLENLVRHILAETKVERLRLSSLLPDEITDELLSLWRDNRLCRHLHIPLQSGCDPVLQRMRRPYSTTDYKRVIDRIREAIPGVAITTDIIVGFPGETQNEFAASYDLCQRMGFANIHVFPYSERPDTQAALLPNKIDERVKKERRDAMLKLAKECTCNFREQFKDHTMMVLWEQGCNNRFWSGLSDNYIRVVTQSNETLKNQLTAVKLVSASDTAKSSFTKELVAWPAISNKTQGNYDM
jgi:threonylcarbamoyladenosine tRNA methylthiotransferase MtaB